LIAEHCKKYGNVNKKQKARSDLENLAGDALELLGGSVALHVVGELVEGHLGSGRIVHEPVGGAAHSRRTNVHADNHVPEQGGR